MAPKNPRIIALFDVDGTLTPARKTASPEVHARLKKLREQITIGVVGGSDLVKQKEQLGDNVINEFDYSFSENGLVAYHKGQKIGETSLRDQYSNQQINRFVNYVLRYVADLDIPVKRGTFVEFRMGMINVSPIGRNCSQEERDEFEKYDHIHNIRKTFVEKLKQEFAEYNFTYSIGGQISFDVFPAGWDKTFCLRYLDAKDYDEIHFFGDKTHPGGNDFEIFTSDRTIGHSVKCPEDTLKLLDELFPLSHLNAYASTLRGVDRVAQQERAVERGVPFFVPQLAKVKTNVMCQTQNQHLLFCFEKPGGGASSPTSYRKQGNQDMYSEENLRRRQRLLEDKQVVAAIARFWDTFPAVRVGMQVLEKKDYVDVFMKFYKALVHPSEFSIGEARKIVERDWDRDVTSSDIMTKPLFFRALFEVADIWTVGIGAEIYASFLNKLFDRVTMTIYDHEKAMWLTVFADLDRIRSMVVDTKDSQAMSTNQDQDPSTGLR
ncbi:hypothetical protein P43SY_009334 [Pythium insidiosum]|uniref:Phosphomannomutase n=1 Tax=Pythium insidiosum TaxID=114742 RepID=A0AAD5Q633_PYTIN|nr:hypothetical protein P43SY_009334 [Pythium insidiosum]